MNADDFARIKAQVGAGEIYGDDNTQGLAQKYGAALTVGLTVADVQEWPAILQDITADEVMAVARKVLTDNIEQLRTVTDALLEYETLSGDEVNALLKGNTPNRSDHDRNNPKSLGTGGSSIPKTRKPKLGGTAPQGA